MNIKDYVYLTIWEKTGELDSRVFKEGFIKRDEVEEVVEEIKSNLMENFDGSSVLEIEEVIKKDGLLDFYGNTGDR